jgi:hypothetical protein
VGLVRDRELSVGLQRDQMRHALKGEKRGKFGYRVQLRDWPESSPAVGA